MTGRGWPSSEEVHRSIAERADALLMECGGLVAEIGRHTLALGNGILSAEPHSVTAVLAPGACFSVTGQWERAVWPAVAAELLMAAADVLDDVADGDPTSQGRWSPGVLLTGAAGLLTLSASAVVRVVEDGVSGATAAALADLLGTAFAQAANGQAANLSADGVRDPLAAYTQAAAKSGPLGSLIARLGARTATDDADLVALFGGFGRCLAVRSQLSNDARDASPAGSADKSDVRAGVTTVPLTFAGSVGAPTGLSGADLIAWESAERERIASAGGLAVALALAEAERLRALEYLSQIEQRGCRVDGLRQLTA